MKADLAKAMLSGERCICCGFQFNKASFKDAQSVHEETSLSPMVFKCGSCQTRFPSDPNPGMETMVIKAVISKLETEMEGEGKRT